MNVKHSDYQTNYTVPEPFTSLSLSLSLSLSYVYTVHSKTSCKNVVCLMKPRDIGNVIAAVDRK